MTEARAEAVPARLKGFWVVVVLLAAALVAWIVTAERMEGMDGEVGFLAWDEAGPYVASAAVAAAGLYQLTPLKDVCLRHCRGPLHFMAHGWWDGRLGALRIGAEHGFYCVGCCWGLMVVLFALGVMSPLWMAAVAAVILAEKVLPFGDRLTRPLAVAFVALGIWVAVSPSSVPGLTEPDKADPGMMQMES